LRTICSRASGHSSFSFQAETGGQQTTWRHLMGRPGSQHPTELELQILKLLWNESPQTVRQLRDGLAEQGRNLAHTSVITTLNTMVEKRQLKRLKPLQGKAFRFAPRVKQDRVSRSMLGDLVKRVFDGSPQALMLSLIDVTDLNEDEVKDLRKLLNERIKDQEE